jgi:hypothetical protein
MRYVVVKGQHRHAPISRVKPTPHFAYYNVPIPTIPRRLVDDSKRNGAILKIKQSNNENDEF